MKRLILWALFFGIVGPLSAQETTKDLEAFTEIKVFDQLEVTLVKSSSNKAIISGQDQDDVVVEVKDNLLKVKMKLENTLSGGQTHVTIHHAANLSLVDVNEGGIIKSKGPLEGDKLDLRAQEGGEIDLEVSVKDLQTKPISGGTIEISGTAESNELLVQAGGEFHGKDLRTGTTTVKIQAGGKAYVNAKDLVDAHVTAGGRVEVYGKPAQTKENKTFGGKIVVH